MSIFFIALLIVVVVLIIIVLVMPANQISQRAFNLIFLFMLLLILLGNTGWLGSIKV